MNLPAYLERTDAGLVLRLSQHSLDKAACPKRFWYYRALRRTPAEVRASLVQGIAGHGALALWRSGKHDGFETSLQAQDNFVDRVFQTHQLPADDYRTAAYLKDALVQYRAEHREVDDFVFDEVENAFELPLGAVDTRDHGPVTVMWTGRRDAVGVSRLDGRRYVFDNKFVSRDEEAEALVATNSGALLGYCFSWLQEHPDKPIYGAILRRTVIRKPTKAAPLNIGLPIDPPIHFSAERIAEWRRDTLTLAAEILARRDAPEAWPQNHSVCRSTWGVCNYIGVCKLPPEDREFALSSDSYRDAGDRFDYELPPASAANYNPNTSTP